MRQLRVVPIRKFVTVCLYALLIAAAPAATPASLAPVAWDSDLKLAEASDLNPHSRVLEINLTARLADVTIAGKRVHSWTYNGGIPGPLFAPKSAIG